MTPKQFQSSYPFLTPIECIEYYSIFEGYPLDSLDIKDTISQSIQVNVFDKITDLIPHFTYSKNIYKQKSIQKMLYKFSINDRKLLKSFRKSHLDFDKQTIYEKLFSKKILEIEYSREEQKELPKGQKLKKELRRYKIEDKVRFIKNFDRFWFRFISYQIQDIINENLQNIQNEITQNIDHFIRRSFEVMCIDFTKKIDNSIIESNSYWDKNIELDILALTKNKKIYLGECKWTNHKINKNILAILDKKCTMSNIKPDTILLFSKSGFSNELKKDCPKNVKLYDIEKISKEFC